jgi:hypothetical protein
MGEWAAKEEEGLFERFGINLGALSALGEASIASSEASEQLGQDKAKFMANDGMQTKLVSLADTMLKYSDDALKGILTDSTKASNFFNTVENLKSIAAKGGFGSQSKEVFEKLSAFSDRIQNYAGKLVTEGVTGGKVNAAARNLEGIGGDQLENVKGLEAEKKQLLLDREVKLVEIENAKKELQRLNDAGIESKFFGVNDAEKMEDKIKALENELSGRNNAFNIDNKIRGVENKLNKFNTLNGLMYNLTELKQLYADNPDQLKAIIERSVNQQGSEFLKESKTKNGNDGIITPIVVNNNGGSTSSIATQENYIKKLDTQGDPYFSREAYAYGSF